MSGQVELMSEKYYQPTEDLPPEQPTDEEPPRKPMTMERFARHASVVICLCMLTAGGLWWHWNGEAVVDGATKPYNPLDTMLWMKGSKYRTQDVWKGMQRAQKAQMRELDFQTYEMNERLKNSFPDVLRKKNRY